MAIDTNAFAREATRPEIPAVSVPSPSPAHSTGAPARDQFALASRAPIVRWLWLRRHDAVRVPGAVQRATLLLMVTMVLAVRCRTGTAKSSVCNGPGSAAHHNAIKCTQIA